MKTLSTQFHICFTDFYRLVAGNGDGNVLGDLAVSLHGVHGAATYHRYAAVSFYFARTSIPRQNQDIVQDIESSS